MRLLYSKLKKALAVLCGLTLSASLFTACGQAQEEAVELLEPAGEGSYSFVLEYTDLEDYLCISDAGLHYASEALYFDTSVMVGNHTVEIGDTVKKGDLILEADLSNVKEQIAELEDSISSAEKDNAYTNEQLGYDVEIEQLRLEKLQSEDADALSIKEQKLAIEQAELALKQAKETQQVSLSALKKQLSECESKLETGKIYAPFDGVITYLPDTSESEVYLNSNSVAAVIADPTKLSVRVDYMSQRVATTYYSRYTALINGTEYDMTLQQPSTDTYLENTEQGKETYTEFTFTNGVPDGITTADAVAIYAYYPAYTHVLVVPYGALKVEKSVYSVEIERDGKQYYQEISIEKLTKSYAVVKEGLQEGDVIYVS